MVWLQSFSGWCDVSYECIFSHCACVTVCMSMCVSVRDQQTYDVCMQNSGKPITHCKPTMSWVFRPKILSRRCHLPLHDILTQWHELVMCTKVCCFRLSYTRTHTGPAYIQLFMQKSHKPPTHFKPTMSLVCGEKSMSWVSWSHARGCLYVSWHMLVIDLVACRSWQWVTHYAHIVLMHHRVWLVASVILCRYCSWPPMSSLSHVYFTCCDIF